MIILIKKYQERLQKLGRWTISCILIIIYFTNLHSTKYAASFLEIGVGAKALGMGGAFCSMIGDASSFYWNPAGLSFLRKAQLSGMYGSQFGSFKNSLGNYHLLGYIHPLTGNAVVAVNWIRLSINEIPIYSELSGSSYSERLHNISSRPSGENEGFITDTEDALFFTFSKMNPLQVDLGWEYHRVNIDIPLGVNLKIIRQSLGESEATGLGIDIGTMLHFHMDDFFETERLGILSFGIHFQDLTGTKLKWDTKYRHQDTVPINVKWGISYRHPFSIVDGFLCISYDRDSRWNGKNHLGFEYCAFQIFSIRAGLDHRNFTCGVGLQFWVLQVDYAFLFHELESQHRISCCIIL